MLKIALLLGTLALIIGHTTANSTVFTQFSSKCTYSNVTGFDSCPTGFCCSQVYEQLANTGGNFTMVPNTTVCSAIEFSGIFNNAANILTNYTFLCLNSSVPPLWELQLI